MTHSFTTMLLTSKPLIMVFIVWPLLTAFLSVAIRRRLPEKWEAWAMKNPKLAFLIELAKAWGFNLPKIFELARRYTARMAGELPEAAIKASTLPEPLKKALQDPRLQAQLAAHVEEMLKDPPATPSATPAPELEAPKV